MSYNELESNESRIETIGGWLEKAESRLNAEEVESPRLSAHLILEQATGRSRAYLLAHPEKTLSSNEDNSANELLTRRLDHEPMAYLVGKKDFRRLTLSVSPHVLIPRPETEGLVDLALSMKPNAWSILDAGTGSGCLALSLLEEYPQSSVIGCDASENALTVARVNDSGQRVHWVRSHWLNPFQTKRFDLIVSNPPYLTTVEMRDLDRQVKDYEPARALYGGADGCDAYRLLIPQAKAVLTPTGVLLLEISSTVEEEVFRLLEISQFQEIEVLKDYAGRERYAKGVNKR